MKGSSRTESPVLLALYGTWTLATYLLEGLPRTLLRPEATGLRLAYAIVANLGIGVLGGVAVLRRLVANGGVTAHAAGFRGVPHALASTVAGVALGLAFFWIRDPATRDVVVVGNAYSQVLVVSVAEVVVCWAVIGSAVEATLRRRGAPRPAVWAALAASLLFGLYHFAHSPPFDTLPFVARLTGVGLLTSLFFFAVRDVYGTIALHNFFALAGVLDALGRAGRLEAYGEWSPPLLAMAAVAVLALVGAHFAWLRRPGEDSEIP